MEAERVEEQVPVSQVQTVERIVEVPQVQVQEVVKQVIVPVVQQVEKIVEVPQIVQELSPAAVAAAARARLAREYATAVAKVGVTTIRLLFEDTLQVFCQGVWVIKKWKTITLGTKAFMSCSIGCGFTLAVGGTFYQYVQLRKKRKNVETKAHDDGWDPAEILAPNPRSEENEAQVPLIDPEPGAMGQDMEAKVEAVEAVILYPTNMTVTEFLGASVSILKFKAGPGVEARRLLLLSAILFWGSMIAYPFAFDSQIDCDATPPPAGLYIFFGLFVVDLVFQIWVLIQTRRGYDILVHSIRRFLFGSALSLVGRFDTFGDVSFTAKIIKCDEITWFSIHEVKYYLPCPLHYFALFSFLVGVVVMQAIPGLFLFMSGSRMPEALKFNECNLILMAMDHEED